MIIPDLKNAQLFRDTTIGKIFKFYFQIVARYFAVFYSATLQKKIQYCQKQPCRYLLNYSSTTLKNLLTNLAVNTDGENLIFTLITAENKKTNTNQKGHIILKQTTLTCLRISDTQTLLPHLTKTTLMSMFQNIKNNN